MGSGAQAERRKLVFNWMSTMFWAFTYIKAFIFIFISIKANEGSVCINPKNSSNSRITKQKEEKR